jgi:hypothetical protein
MQWLKNLFSPRPSAAGARVDKLPSRNEPCWCGSGKKYKQCHLRKDAADRIEAGHATRAAVMAARNAGKNIVTGGGKGGGSKTKAAKPEEFQEWKGGGKAQ